MSSTTAVVHTGIFIVVLVTASFYAWLKTYFWPFGGK
jgi:NADH:ubiquinone oxidoreductase subunit 3 (subunit A)